MPCSMTTIGKKQDAICVANKKTTDAVNELPSRIKACNICDRMIHVQVDMQ